MIDRRRFLSHTLAGGAMLAFAPQLAWARAETDRKLVVIVQRGAADGLATVIPVGDPQFASQRRAFAEEADAALPLDGTFRLHPALERLKTLYDSGEALFAHAVASPYRERSHFDGQNVLETGGAEPFGLRDGWLNRLLTLLPGGDSRALALAVTVPLILRGDNRVGNYAPSVLPDANEDLLMRVGRLYDADPELHALWNAAMDTEARAGETAARRSNPASLGALAARLMTGADGARIVTIDTDGWDTHANQTGRLRRELTGLNAMIGALRDGLGDEWRDTLVVVATEFGRTVAPNGTGGTDHGTGSAAMLLGGTVAGGRVHADWPGLATAQLYEGRDLRPTLSMDALLAGAVAAHFGIEPQRAASVLFPETNARPVEGLVRA